MLASISMVCFVMDHGVRPDALPSPMTEHGRFRLNMSWVSEALCAGVDTEFYFDSYENDIDIANEVDRMCLGCPVIKECFEYGVSTESWGVWGGIFLIDGKVDNARNAHKSSETWNSISMRIKNG